MHHISDDYNHRRNNSHGPAEQPPNPNPNHCLRLFLVPPPAASSGSGEEQRRRGMNHHQQLVLCFGRCQRVIAYHYIRLYVVGAEEART
jgi:hypothetical protein